MKNINNKKVLFFKTLFTLPLSTFICDKYCFYFIFYNHYFPILFNDLIYLRRVLKSLGDIHILLESFGGA